MLKVNMEVLATELEGHARTRAAALQGLDAELPMSYRLNQ